MNRKVGDKVKIISSEKALEVVGFIEFMMKRWCEKKATIKRKLEYGGTYYYRIDLDDQLFLWTDKMFEKERGGNLLKNE